MTDFEALRDKPAAAYIWRVGFVHGTGYQHVANSNYRYEKEGPAAPAYQAGSLLAQSVNTDEKLTEAFLEADIIERIIKTELYARDIKRVPPAKPVKRGWFRRPKVEVPKAEITPGRRLTVGDFDHSDNDEPAFALGYNLTSQGYRTPRATLDGINRDGTPLAVAAVMDEQEATDLFENLKAKPRTARDFARFLSLEVLSVGTYPDAGAKDIDTITTNMQFATDKHQLPHEGEVVEVPAL